VVIVGGSLAGLSAAEALRREGYTDRIIVIGDEDHPPYDRPPLSKQVLAGVAEPQATALRPQASLEALEVDWQLGRCATKLDLATRVVVLSDGESVSFDGLIIATGATPRRLATPPGMAGIHVLRTLDDCVAIREELAAKPRVAVIGAGFIGAEVAATCRKRGLEVDLIEALPVPLAGALGPEAAAWCSQLHPDHGVRLHCGVTVTAFEGAGRVEALRLSNGRVLPADLVVVGVGVTPATGWLEGSGLVLNDGVVCDDRCAASAPDVVAAGDVARWYNPLFEENMRVEHWTNAIDQGRFAARRLVRGPEASGPFAPVPYFWSDQYDVKIQFCGRTGPGDEVRLVHGAVEEHNFVAVFIRADRLTGVLAMNCGPEFAAYSRLVAKRSSVTELATTASA
jgi:NADPH-dependent 2,4-dienoyl-CoA reductase/sulfur reductase-like enzyme